MSTVPSDLPDIGSTAQRLRQNPRFDPVASGVGPEEYFVWTRFDGATTLKDLIVMTGFPTPKAVEIVRKLRTMGAILLPGEVAPPKLPAQPAVRRTPPQGVRARPESEQITEKPTTRVSASAVISPDDAKAMAEDIEIPLEERDRILTMQRRIR